jgi:hypothetical protein
VPRRWDARGFEKRRQTLSVYRGFSKLLARKGLVQVAIKIAQFRLKRNPMTNLNFSQFKFSALVQIEYFYRLAVMASSDFFRMIPEVEGVFP